MHMCTTESSLISLITRQASFEIGATLSLFRVMVDAYECVYDLLDLLRTVDNKQRSLPVYTLIMLSLARSPCSGQKGSRLFQDSTVLLLCRDNFYF